MISWRRTSKDRARSAFYLKGILVITLLGFLLLQLPTMAQETFDHFSTGFVLDGAHVNVSCEACHVSATFGATEPTCVGCHSQSGLVRSSSKPADHVMTTGECSDCHVTASWSAITFMDHSSITGSCVSCHNSIQATGKTPTHISSGDQCDDCHNSIAWTPAVFDHSGVFGNCVGCHNSVTATGKHATHISSGDSCDDCHIDSSPGRLQISITWTFLATVSAAITVLLQPAKISTHIQTTNICEDCHSPTVWAPALTVDHTQVLGTCGTCHDGATATGKHSTHIAGGNNCDDCHTTVAWIPATFDHDAITGNCISCHDGTGATGKNATHIQSTSICEDCHSPTSMGACNHRRSHASIWAAVAPVMTVSPQAGNTRRTLPAATPATTVTVPSPGYRRISITWTLLATV